MKKILQCLAALLFAFGAMFAPVAAQQSPQPQRAASSALPTSCYLSDPYTVEAGDSLWRLNQKEWGVLVKCNPFLAVPARSITKPDGTYVVIIKPGEKLFGVKKMQGKLTPFLPPPVVLAPASSPVKVASAPENSYGFLGIPWWVWLAIAALLALFFYGFRKAERESEARWDPRNAVNTDPTTAGPPMVPGGITEENADELFQRAAARQAGVPQSYQQFTVLERTRGRIYGPMTVSYANGTTMDWHLNGQVAYQARVRFANGHEETLYMLQACGNDLRYQGVNRYQPGDGFRFVPDPIDVMQPAPAPVPTTTPANVAAPAVAEPSDEASPDGEVKIEYRVGMDGNQDMLRVTGLHRGGFTFVRKPDGSATVNFRDAPKSGSKTST